MPAVGTVHAQAGRDGLTDHSLPLAAGAGHLVRSPLAHDVDNVARGVDPVGDDDRAVRCLGLHVLRPAQHVPLGARNAHLQHLLLPVMDQVTVLCVHHAQSANFLAPLERLDHLLVRKLEHVLVRHKHLERVNPALPRQYAHLLGHLLRPPRDRHVERVVTVHLRRRPGQPRVVRREERLPFLRDDKVNQHGCAACHRRPGAVVVVVHSHCPHERHFHVRMGIDTTGNDIVPGSVHAYCFRGNVEVFPHRHDLLILDVNVRLKLTVLVHHRASMHENTILSRLFLVHYELTKVEGVESKM
mmetsp:Transcript_15425/g.43728  ORF Transcript_15425/g.43728 Transcript_15425/m.43728 type:complete len:300 (-) Transcript_15425:22-921(-)